MIELVCYILAIGWLFLISTDLLNRGRDLPKSKLAIVLYLLITVGSMVYLFLGKV